MAQNKVREFDTDFRQLNIISEGMDEGNLAGALMLFANRDDEENERVLLRVYSPTENIVYNAAADHFDFENILEDTMFGYFGDMYVSGTSISEQIISQDIFSDTMMANEHGGGNYWQKIGSGRDFIDCSPSNAGRCSDVNGNYYYLGTYQDSVNNTATLIIYDITDRLNPVRVSPTDITGLPQGTAGCKGCKYHDGYVYLTYDTGGTGTLRIVDVSDPTTPVVVAGDTLDLGSASGGATLDIDTVNDILYVSGAYELSSIDISDPTTPVLLDQMSPSGFDMTFWTLKYQAGYVYMSGRGVTETLVIVDVSDPENMATVTPATPIELHGTWSLFVDGNYVYMANGGSFSTDDYDKFCIVDVTDKENPEIVGSLPISRSPSSYLRKVGDLVYLSNWGLTSEIGDDPSNLFVINVKDPTDPFIVGRTSVGYMPLNLYPVDDGRYLYVAFAPFSREVPFWGVLESKGIYADYAEIRRLEVSQSSLSAIKSNEMFVDLSAIVEGLVITFPVLEAEANSSMPEAIDFPYALGVYDKFAVIDQSESGIVEILFTTPDFITSNGSMGVNLIDGYFYTNWDFCPYEVDMYSMGREELPWVDGWFSGDVHADTFVAGTSLTIGSTAMTEQNLIDLLALL